MHNGHISNWLALKNKYDRKALEVDSEHIFMHLAEGKDLGELDGWGAVVWWEMPVGQPQKRKLFLSTFGNHDNLAIAKLPNGIIAWSSTRAALEKAAKMCGVKNETWYKVENLHKYEIARDGDNWELFERGEQNWGKNVERPLVVVPARGHFAGMRNSRLGSVLCNVGRCEKKLENPNYLVCDFHATKLGWERYGIHSTHVN